RLLPSGLGVHAISERGHDPLHADGAPGHVRDAGPRRAPGPGPHAEAVPRGRARLRQGGPRRDADRSRAAQHVRDGGDPQARERVAEGHDLGAPQRRDGPDDPFPGHAQHLLDADHDPHRDARHRLPHPGRGQGPRPRPDRDRPHRPRHRGRALAERVSLPPGYRLGWAGQFEYLERARGRLALLVPLTLLIVFVLLYLNTASVTKTMIILLAVPFSAVGAIWLLWALGYNMSVAVWVGLIALLGVDAETGVFMLLYLDLAFDERRRRGLMRSLADLKEAIIEGAVKRLRPKVMTLGVMFMGLLPITWSH